MPNKKQDTRFPAEIAKKVTDETFGIPCDDCIGTMQLKWSGLYKKLFYGCDLFPTCMYSFGATETGGPLPGVDDRPKPSIPKPFLAKTLCRCCDGMMQVKWSHRHNRWFHGCGNWPNCGYCTSIDTWLWDLVRQDFPVHTTADTKKSKKKPKKRNKQLEAVKDDSYLERTDFWSAIKFF